MGKSDPKSKNSVSLKGKYRVRLIAVFVANLAVLSAAVTYGVIQFDGINTVATNWQGISKNVGSIAAPALIALAITTVLSGVLSSDTKARIVFCRWSHPLPGSRAFSNYLRKDTRIDFDALMRTLGQEPTDPADQNSLWYRRIYKTVQNDPIVLEVHKDFLFCRDYAALSLLFLIFLGAVGIYAISSPTTVLIYLSCLAIQFITSLLAARNYGIRLVTTSAAVWQRATG
jgi:hypothetical protein